MDWEPTGFLSNWWVLLLKVCDELLDTFVPQKWSDMFLLL